MKVTMSPFNTEHSGVTVTSLVWEDTAVTVE